MKEGWTYKKLGEVVDNLRTGLNPRVHFRLNTTDAKGYYITVRELKGFSFTVDDRTDRINDYAIKRINERSNLKIGDVLYSGTGTIGRTALVQELPTWWNIKEGVYALTPKHDILDSSFLIYAMHSESFSNKVLSRTSGATVRSIPMKELKEIVISFPSLSEQKRIVERLDAAFENIDKLKANAEKQLAEARTLFQKSLAKAMEPKEGWEEKKLGDVCKSVNYGTSLPSTENGKYKYLRMNNITIDGTLDLTNLKTIDVPEKDFEKCVVRKGDLLFNRTNSPELVGKTCIFKEDEEMIIAGYIIRIRFNDSIYPQFASYFINLQRQLGNLRPLIVGAVHQANISAKAIQSINIQFPPLAEQQRIVERLDALSANIRKYEEIQRQIISECDALKQALLRKVFE